MEKSRSVWFPTFVKYLKTLFSGHGKRSAIALSQWSPGHAKEREAVTADDMHLKQSVPCCTEQSNRLWREKGGLGRLQRQPGISQR